MSDERQPDLNLVLELLRHIQSDQRVIRDDVRELKLRTSTVEHQIAQVIATEAAHYASLAGRLDRVDDRLDRMERRLGLLDA
jgi:hypothetical protein